MNAKQTNKLKSAKRKGTSREKELNTINGSKH